MKSLWIHVAVAAVFSILIVVLAILPQDMVIAMGCRNRGLLAGGIALVSGICSLVWASFAMVERIRGRGSKRQILFSVAYALPLVLVLWFA